MFFMPAYVSGERTVSVKIARLNPRNSTVSLPTVMSDILVYDSQSDVLLAEIPGECLTAIRTAASSTAATDVLAQRRLEWLGLLGTGRLGAADAPVIQHA